MSLQSFPLYLKNLDPESLCPSPTPYRFSLTVPERPSRRPPPYTLQIQPRDPRGSVTEEAQLRDQTQVSPVGARGLGYCRGVYRLLDLVLETALLSRQSVELLLEG